MAPRKPQKARDPESDEEPSFGADREESDGQSDSSNMQGLSPSLSPPIKRSSRTASSKVTSTISDSFSRFTRDGYGASILAKAKAETSKGYRPSKATHSAKLKETLVSGSGSGSGNSKKSAGRQAKATFSVKAIVFIVEGTEDYTSLLLKNYLLGKIHSLQRKHLACVAEGPSELELSKDWTATETVSFFKQHLPKPFDYFASISKHAASNFTQLRAERGRLQADTNETLRGDEIFARLPAGKGWDSRFIFITGPMLLPDEIVDSWTSFSAAGVLGSDLPTSSSSSRAVSSASSKRRRSSTPDFGDLSTLDADMNKTPKAATRKTKKSRTNAAPKPEVINLSSSDGETRVFPAGPSTSTAALPHQASQSLTRQLSELEIKRPQFHRSRKEAMELAGMDPYA